MSAGAEINAKNKYGWPALMEAYFEGRPDVVVSLRRLGAGLDGLLKTKSWPGGWHDMP